MSLVKTKILKMRYLTSRPQFCLKVLFGKPPPNPPHTHPLLSSWELNHSFRMLICQNSTQ